MKATEEGPISKQVHRVREGSRLPRHPRPTDSQEVDIGESKWEREVDKKCKDGCA